MTGSDISIGVVFLAGLASFFTPCVLPIMPVYLSLLSGLSFEEMQEESAIRGVRVKLVGNTVAFILGFGLVTVGLLGGIVAAMANLDEVWLSAFRIGGAVIVFILALHMIGVFRITALFKERRFHTAATKVGFLGAVLVGAAFAFGWTPCLGPVIGSVAGLAAGTAKTGLLLVYTLGLAIPFLFAAMFVNLFLASMRKLTKHLRTVEIVSGVLLLAMGVLLVTNQLSLLR